MNVFSKNKINELFAHHSQNHAINTEKKKSFFGKLYNLSQTKLIILRDYLKKHLKKNFIFSSISSAEAFVIFVKKKNDELWLYMNYQKLNVITKKNRHSLPLIEKTLNWLIDVKKYIKLNIQHAYNLIRIKPGDEWKTIFKTNYNHFEYKIMSFELINIFLMF